MNILLLGVLAVLFSASVVLVSQSVEAGEKNNVEETAYFSIEPLDNWIYDIYSDSTSVDFTGLGPSNTMTLFPNVFDAEETNNNKGVKVTIQQDERYSVKNAPLATYVKYKIDQQTDIMNVTSQEKMIVDGEETIKINGVGVGDSSGLKYVRYLIMHDNEPYYMGYRSELQHFDKYLPEFEQMVQTFQFKD